MSSAHPPTPATKPEPQRLRPQEQCSESEPTKINSSPPHPTSRRPTSCVGARSSRDAFALVGSICDRTLLPLFVALVEGIALALRPSTKAPAAAYQPCAKVKHQRREGAGLPPRNPRKAVQPSFTVRMRYAGEAFPPSPARHDERWCVAGWVAEALHPRSACATTDHGMDIVHGARVPSLPSMLAGMGDPRVSVSAAGKASARCQRNVVLLLFTIEA